MFSLHEEMDFARPGQKCNETVQLPEGPVMVRMCMFFPWMIADADIMGKCCMTLYVRDRIKYEQFKPPDITVIILIDHLLIEDDPPGSIAI